MRIIPLVYLILLYPVLAMQYPCEQQYRDRLLEREREITKFHLEINSALNVKEDILTSVKNEIREEASRLLTETSFQEELDALLEQLRPAEEFFSAEQRHALISFPALEHFQSLNTFIKTLESFIIKWKAIAAYAESLELCANQTLWYQSEWAALTSETKEKLASKTMLCGDLLKIYAGISYFHAERGHLATALEYLKDQLQEASVLIPVSLHYLDTAHNEYLGFFNVRGTLLWEIIRYSDLVRTAEETRDLPDSYEELPLNFFIENPNPIKTVFSKTDKQTNISVLIPSRENSSLSRKKINTPLLFEPSAEMKGGSLVTRLGEAFILPDQWEEKVIAFKKKELLLRHANIITSHLQKLVDYYASFRTTYLQNLSSCHDIFATKALLNAYSLSQGLISQTLARRASRLKTNGPLCFNMPDTSNINRMLLLGEANRSAEQCEEQHGWDSHINNSLFFRRLPSDVPNHIVGAEHAISLLESLFGIHDSEPIVHLFIENIRFLEEKFPSKRRVSENLVTETMHRETLSQFLGDPSIWVEQSRFTLLTAHRSLKHCPLPTFLEKVALGQDSFKRLNRYRFGLEFLFSMVSQSSRPIECYSLVETNSGQLDLKRTGPSDLMFPLFQRFEDSPYVFIGKNVLCYLPLANEEIPFDVKKHFKENNILLILSYWLSDLTKLQGYFDPIIERYKLNSNHEISEDLKVDLTHAQMFGLSTSCRPETICQIIQNFFIMAKILEKPKLTYKELHEALRPLEAQCIDSIKEKARRKIQEGSLEVLFNDIIPLKIAHLEKELSESSTSEHLIYSNEELASFKKAAELCFSDYIGFDSYEDRPITFDDFIPTILNCEPPNILLNVSEGGGSAGLDINTKTFFGKVMPSVINFVRHKLGSILESDQPPYSSEDLDLFDQHAKECLGESNLSPLVLISRLPTKSQTFFEKKYHWWIKSGTFFHQCLEIKWASEKKDTLNFFGKVIPSVINQLRDLYSQTATLGEPPLLIDLNLVEQAAKECLATAKTSIDTSFEELISQLPSKIRAFFEQKHHWWIHVIRSPEAKFILKAWEITTSDHADNSIDLLRSKSLEPLSSDFWKTVGIRTNRAQPVYCQTIECNYPLSSMVQDLITHADLSLLPPHESVKVLDILLTLSPRPVECHESWPRMVQVAREHFLGMPPHVRSFLHLLGLQPREEASVLQDIQMRECQSYPKRSKIIDKHPLIPEQHASHILRQLWAGLLEFDQKEDQDFFDGILDLLLLPPCSSPELSSGSIGFASNPQSKGGIFKLSYKVGDHYPLTQSSQWINLFQSRRALPNKIRLNFLSHALPLLHLQWLDVLKQFCPDITFHPWFNKMLIQNSTLLQRLLLSQVSLPFHEIMATILPEIDFVIQQKFKGNNNDVDIILRSQNNGQEKLNPIEYKGAIYNYFKNGKNILTLLREWEEEHMRCMLTPPLTLDDAATEWVAHMVPGEYGPEILAGILDLATHFTIDPAKINATLWNNPKILTDLVSVNAPLECLKLVAAFRTRLPFKDISLTLRTHSTKYQISGLKGHVEVICDLIRLFPGVTSLSLDNNGISSLRPFISSLQALSSLTDLSLKNNPIHNPAPHGDCTEN